MPAPIGKINASDPRSLQAGVDRLQERVNVQQGKSLEAVPTLADLIELGLVDRKRVEELLQDRR